MIGNFGAKRSPEVCKLIDKYVLYKLYSYSCSCSISMIQTYNNILWGCFSPRSCVMVENMTDDRYHNIYENGSACFWTSSIINRIPVFKSRTAALSLLKIWDHCRDKYNVKLLGYVVMPDHIHIVLWSQDVADIEIFIEQTLRRASSEIVGMTACAAERGELFAKAWLTTFRMHASKGSRARVWKERGHGFPVCDEETLSQKLMYMHNNPVRNGLVECAENWEFSSAAWYSNQSGPISIDRLD